ncbi:MAG: hypothetical protein MUC87_02855 [Bacteroidia bacterium]|jgi:hypothetical protein|nr:hypothetical protein [Bacteroidia bacterium]
MYRLLILFLLLSTPAWAKKTIAQQLFKTSAHAVQVRVCQSPVFPSQKNNPTPDAYRLVVQEVYKSKTLKAGDTIAITAAMFTAAVDTMGRPYFSNLLQPDGVFIVFLSDDTPRSYTFNKRNYSLFILADAEIGIQPFTLHLHNWLGEERNKMKKK